MKQVLLCGMLLALLTSVSFAQRGRAVGGVGPTARLGAPNVRMGPDAVGIAPSTGIPPSARIGGVAPNATRVAPNAIPVAPHATTVAPNATTVAPNAKTVAPNARTTGAETVTPRARTVDPDALPQ